MTNSCKKRVKKLLPMSKAKEDGKVKCFLYVQYIILLITSIALVASTSAYLGMETENFCSYSLKDDPASNATDIDKWARNHDIDTLHPNFVDLSTNSLSDLVTFYNDTEAQQEMFRDYYFSNFSEEYYNLTMIYGGF